jgi:hypothetical protein
MYIRLIGRPEFVPSGVVRGSRLLPPENARKAPEGTLRVIDDTPCDLDIYGMKATKGEH